MGLLDKMIAKENVYPIFPELDRSQNRNAYILWEIGSFRSSSSGLGKVRYKIYRDIHIERYIFATDTYAGVYDSIEEIEENVKYLKPSKWVRERRGSE